MPRRTFRKRLTWGAAWAVAVLAGRVAAGEEVNRFVAQTPPRPALEQKQMFHLPPGFRIELVGSEPQVVNPIKLCFDAAGRLYFSQSIEYPYPVAEDKSGRDTIKAISDNDADGVPETIHTFADGLNIPISITPIPDGLLGHSIPYLYRFADPDQDARANGREVAYGKFAYQDTHGMCSSLSWWIDGWVYGSHGFSNTSTLEGSDKQAVTVNSGNTFRLRAEGTHIEQFTHGQVNPFGMCFDPLGNIYTADCHSRPITMLLRGGYYPSFSKPHDGLGFAPEMMQHSHGSTGLSGIVYYAADQFPKPYHDTLFVGNPVTGRVNHDRIEIRGSTYKAIEQPDFLSCDDPWFRPVDLKLGPDGALYIADFYNCIIGHYEVPLDHPQRDRKHGRIWRVSYAGGDGTPQPARTSEKRLQMTEATVDELIDALNHPNLVIRTHATHQLVHRVGRPAEAPVRKLFAETSSELQRAHAVWVLLRLDVLDDGSVRRGIQDPAALVRVHTVKAVAERTDWSQADRRLVIEALDDENSFVRRAAVEALGRHPHEENVGPLLRLWQATSDADEMLIHAARIALRDTLGGTESLNRALAHAEGIDKAEEMVADVCLGIPAASAAAYLLNHYEHYRLPGDKMTQIIEHVGRHLPQPDLSRYIRWATSLKRYNDDVAHRALLALYRVLSGRGEPFPAELQTWADEAAARYLAAADSPLRLRGIELAQELRLQSTASSLIRTASDQSSPPSERSGSLRALMVVDKQAAQLVALALATNSGCPHDVRSAAVDALGQLNSPESRQALVELLTIAPQSFAPAVARSIAQSHEGCESLLAAVEAGKASAHLLQDRTVEDRLRQSKLPNLPSRLEKQLAGLPPADERLREQIARHRKDYQAVQPNAERGGELFGKHCAACHRIDGRGNKVGPELDGVGRRGLERLLEDVLDPHRNVDANFRATVVVLDGGQIVQGLVQREEDGNLLLVDTLGKERRIPLAEIAERNQSRLSAMPADVVDKLSGPELYDLLGYLVDQTQMPQAAPVPASE